jgi:hypothetical protein
VGEMCCVIKKGTLRRQNSSASLEPCPSKTKRKAATLMPWTKHINQLLPEPLSLPYTLFLFCCQT